MVVAVSERAPQGIRIVGVAVANGPEIPDRDMVPIIHGLVAGGPIAGGHVTGGVCGGR